MRIALLVALAYFVSVPFIINLVDARPRYDAGYRAAQNFPRQAGGWGQYSKRAKRAKRAGEELPFYPSQVTCVFLITLAVRVGCKLDEASRHLAALQTIRDAKKASADQSSDGTS